MTERDEMIAREKEQMATWDEEQKAEWKRQERQQRLDDAGAILRGIFVVLVVGGLFYAVASVVIDLSRIASAVPGDHTCPIVSNIEGGKGGEAGNFGYVLAPDASGKSSGGQD